MEEQTQFLGLSEREAEEQIQFVGLSEREEAVVTSRMLMRPTNIHVVTIC